MYCLTFLLLALQACLSYAASPSEWRSRSIYFVMTDRFARTDGSTTAPCNITAGQYCGGTWQGLINKLDYIKNMGFTAVSFGLWHQSKPAYICRYGLLQLLIRLRWTMAHKVFTDIGKTISTVWTTITEPIVISRHCLQHYTRVVCIWWLTSWQTISHIHLVWHVTFNMLHWILSMIPNTSISPAKSTTAIKHLPKIAG